MITSSALVVSLNRFRKKKHLLKHQPNHQPESLLAVPVPVSTPPHLFLQTRRNWKDLKNPSSPPHLHPSPHISLRVRRHAHHFRLAGTSNYLEKSKLEDFGASRTILWAETKSEIYKTKMGKFVFAVLVAVASLVLGKKSCVNRNNVFKWKKKLD